METIGDRIKRLRSLREISQAELAERAGMTQTGIASIESGAVLRPRKLVEIARALDVSPEALLGEETVAAGERARHAMISAAWDMGRSGRLLHPSVAGRIPVVGEVAAGVWRDPKQIDDEETSSLPVLSDPMSGEQVGYLVRGASANKVAREGDVAVGALIAMRSPNIRDGDLVVFERAMAPGGPIERTLRRFSFVGEGAAELTFDSDDSRFSETLKFPWGSDDAMAVGEIVARVQWIYRWP
ncbi:helix-turn-helix domain-containing protein [Chelatococcus sp. GCM10030263]|uniref:helix-turn-helix domain-containing protein n=1 Tax=Chelatococcus sp. GCM10030263 TaxID=3273387 RepID=UPI00360F2620